MKQNLGNGNAARCDQGFIQALAEYTFRYIGFGIHINFRRQFRSLTNPTLDPDAILLSVFFVSIDMKNINNHNVIQQ